MKPSHFNSACLMLFVFGRLLSAQTVDPSGSVTGTPWGWVSLVVIITSLSGGLLVLRSIVEGRKSKASMQWPSVPGTVVFSEMVEHAAGEANDIRPEVIYSYVVNERAYQCSRVKFSVARGQKIVAKHPKGCPVPVFFDPRQPSDAVLEKGGSTRAILLAGVAVIVFGCAVGLAMVG